MMRTREYSQWRTASLDPDGTYCSVPQMDPPTVPDREKGFNGPAVRINIARSSDYLAHPIFHNYIKWQPVSNGRSTLMSTMNIEPDGCASPADIIVVGIVSDDRPNLGELGNWNASFNMKLHESKQQFTLKRPTGFLDFEDDFDIAIRRLKDLQDEVAVKGSKQLWFILADDTLRFTHNLFQEKPEIPDESSDMDDHDLDMVKQARLAAEERSSISTQYPIKIDMQESVGMLLIDYDLVPLEVYDKSKTLVLTKDVARNLKGALVQVTFNLRYSFVTTQRASNFKGQVVQINILKNTTRVSFSPRKRGPINLQTAVLREDQVEAVKQFLLPKLLPREGSLTADEEPVHKKHKANEEVTPTKQSARIASTRGNKGGSVKTTAA